MGAIARAAGITRRTLYARYPDGRAVFVDMIPWALARRGECDRQVVNLLRSHNEAGAIEVDDLELAAGRFIAMIEHLPRG